MLAFIKGYNKWFRNPFTVACDRTPFNDCHGITVFYAKGYLNALLIAEDWITVHSYGRADIILGHKQYS